MSHYFDYDSSLKSEEKLLEIRVLKQEFSLYSDHQIFSKNQLDFGTELLLKTPLTTKPKKILDLGCGYGVVGIYYGLSKKGWKVTLIDVNPRAIELSQKSIELNNLANCKAKLIDALEIKDKFDLILTNPPIRVGKQILYNIYLNARDNLNPGGEFRIVIRKQQGALSTLDYLNSIFVSVDILARSKGYFVFSCKC